MKKFFYLFFSIIFCCFISIQFTGCSKSEVDKASKNLSSYSLDISLDDDAKTIQGKESIIYYNKTGKELSYLCLHLYPRAFRKDALIKPYSSLNIATCFPNGLSYGNIEIKSVKVNGEGNNFEIAGEDEDILKLNFGFDLQNKKSAEIEIEFLLTIPNCTHRFGYYDGNINLGNWYPIVCEFDGEKFDTSPYYSTGDPFNSSVANYEVRFTYPSSYLLCSTGKIDLSSNNETTTATIKAKAVRDFAMCLSSKSKIVKDEASSVEVMYMGYSDDENHNEMLTISKEALSYFNKTFGTYPYSTLSIVKTPFIYGGMEYPNVVFVSDAIDDEEEYLKVIVHEIAHQWWYSAVGNNEIQDAWLDESLAEYSTALFFENHNKYGLSYKDLVQDALSSYLLYVDVIGTIRGEVNTKMNLKVYEYQNDYEYSYMVYVKGVIMFDNLRDVVGINKIVAGLKKYYADNKFKIASTADFFKAFKSACHKDLDGFFDSYLNGTVIIANLN